MSVIITGLSKPRACERCRFISGSLEWYCEAGQIQIYDYKTVHKDCPMRDYPDPQKPKKDGARYRCPSCGKLVGEEAYIRYHKQQFCSDCGQRIDWGDGYHYPKGEQDDERKADG